MGNPPLRGFRRDRLQHGRGFDIGKDRQRYPRRFQEWLRFLRSVSPSVCSGSSISSVSTRPTRKPGLNGSTQALTQVSSTTCLYFNVLDGVAAGLFVSLLRPLVANFTLGSC